jgi:hypothetical protein
MKPSPHVRASITDEGVILLDIHSGQILSANAVAARIWRGLEQGLSLPAIVDGIAADADVDRTIVLRDAAAFLSTLTSRGLVTNR